jgi:hypothetical protein
MSNQRGFDPRRNQRFHFLALHGSYVDVDLIFLKENFYAKIGWMRLAYSYIEQVLHQVEEDAEEKEVVRICCCNSKAHFPGFGNPFQLVFFQSLQLYSGCICSLSCVQ